MPARTNWRICASSSTISTCWSPSVMSVLIIVLHRQGQPNRNCHTLIYALARGLNGPVIGRHESAGDPESQPETRSYLGVAITAKELLPEQHPVVRVKASSLIGDRNCKLAGFKMAADADRGLRRRIFCRIVENLSQCALHQHRIYTQQHEFLWKRYVNRAAAQTVATTLKRRIDEIGRLCPVELCLQTVAADARSVENILDFDIKPFRFLMNQRRKPFQAGIAGNLRRQ